MIGRLADRYGVNRDSPQKYPAMANPKVGYTQEELNAWFRIFREQQAIDNTWSCEVLRQKVVAKQGRHRDSVKSPSTMSMKSRKTELYQQLLSWQQWFERHKAHTGVLTPKVSKQIEMLKKKIARTAAAVEAIINVPLGGGRRDRRPRELFPMFGPSR